MTQVRWGERAGEGLDVGQVEGEGRCKTGQLHTAHDRWLSVCMSV